MFDHTGRRVRQVAFRPFDILDETDRDPNSERLRTGIAKKGETKYRSGVTGCATCPVKEQ